MTNTLQNQSLSILHVSGADALTFLQGQLTNDINQLSFQSVGGETSHQWSALCNPKGRAIATMIIYPTSEHSPETPDLNAIMQADSIDDMTNHLRKFVFRSKVNFEKLDKQILFSEDESVDLSEHANDIEATISLTESLKFHVMADESALDIDGIRAVDSEALSTLGARYALPLIGDQLKEALIPNHIDFEAWSGINYKKGCYTGQEVIARLHYLGKSKSKLYRHISQMSDTSNDENIGPDNVFAPEKFGSQPVGSILWCSQSEDGGKVTRIISMKTGAEGYPLAFVEPDNVVPNAEIALVFNETQ